MTAGWAAAAAWAAEAMAVVDSAADLEVVDSAEEGWEAMAVSAAVDSAAEAMAALAVVDSAAEAMAALAVVDSEVWEAAAPVAKGCVRRDGRGSANGTLSPATQQLTWKR